jgi:cytochrome c oxidase cbb3-type subunit 2
MSLRVFILSLSATFGIAWLFVVVVPYFQMRSLAPIMTKEASGREMPFVPKRAGRIADGAEVYGANGCYLCHTQVVRPTYAGNDLYRADWGGLKDDEDRGDTRRETNAYDFEGEKFAHIGVSRFGSDLSNLGRRVERYAGEGSPENWLYTYLYNPRLLPQRWDSKCPPHPFLFEKREKKGQESANALCIPAEPGYEWVPTSDARALVSYLLSLKKDHALPPELDFAPRKSDDEG